MLYFVPGMRSLTRAFEEWVWGCQSRFLFWRFKVDEKRMETEIKTFLKRIVPRKLGDKVEEKELARTTCSEA